MKYLIVAVAFLFACIVFAPIYAAPAPMLLMRATTAPQATNAPMPTSAPQATNAPMPTTAPPSESYPAPPSDDPYPAPAHRRHDAPKDAKPAPGLHCGHC